ncbi:MAG: flagellar assembly protein FliW, partial [Candidatus Hydrogenedentes bacterium]|nr:flagellar assembly protein FliW [Candidatus Hydrogenedentota bacterium]
AVKWLQSVERGDVAFILMDPRMVYPGYEVDLQPDAMAELAIDSVTELDVYSVVVVPADHSQVRTNLKAPIIVNPVQRLAKQAILERRDYPIQFFLARPREESEGPKEVAHARADT